MLRLTNNGVTVPDKFRWTCPVDGVRITGMDVESWYSAIKKHCSDNEHSAPSLAECEHQLCLQLGPGWCSYADGSSPERFVDMRFTLGDFMNGMAVIKQFVVDGMPLVPQEEAEARSLTCSRCPMNVPIPGCSPCYKLADLIASLAGKITTKSDQWLRACAICKCSNEAQTRIPLDVLAHGVTGEMREQFNQVGLEHCWKRNI